MTAVPPRDSVDPSDAGTGDVAADQLSLGRRLRQPRTILSLVVPIVLLVLVFRIALNVNVSQLVAGVRAANPLLLLAAFLIFYAGFPLRGFRWVLLLRGAGFRVGTPDATRILFLSWLVNCLVPAKLGDVYRAYLLKINSTASLSRTFGTVFIERILDLFVIAVLGLAAGYWSFRSGLPPSIQVVFAIGAFLFGHDTDHERSEFYESITNAVGPASAIVLIGHGKGKANEMLHLTQYWERKHPGVARNVVGAIDSDLESLSENQVLALIRDWFDEYQEFF